MVNVDRPAGEELAEIGAEDLHVARQHHQIDTFTLDQRFDLQFLLTLDLGAAAGRQRQVMEGDAIAGGQLGKVGVIGDDRRDLDIELPAAPAKQQVIEAVAVLADHQQHARLARQPVDAQTHIELIAHGDEQALQRLHIGQVIGGLEVDPHEEQPGRVFKGDVAELLGIEDVATGLIEQTGDGVHDALGIAAGKGQDELTLSRHSGRNSTQ